MPLTRRPIALAVLAVLSMTGCTAGDDSAPSPEPSTELAHECDSPIGGIGAGGAASGGGSVEYTSTGLPTEELEDGHLQKDDQGYWVPPMSDDAFLLVGLPEDPGSTVTKDAVTSVVITSFGVNAQGARSDCLENLDATVEFVETDYLPLWKVSIDDAFRSNWDYPQVVDT